MNFAKPTAADVFVSKHVGVGTDGEAWDVIGEPLNHGVEQTLPAYDAKLELNLRPKPGEKRAEVNEVRWGKIKKDAAKIDALGAAMENISTVIKQGKDQLAHDWKGESFEAFKVAVERIEKTLNDYAAAAKTTASGLTTAMTRVESLYKQYQTTSNTQLTFESGYGKPEAWHKVSQGDIDGHLVDVCPCVAGCNKDEDEEARIVRDKVLHPGAYKFYENVYCGYGGNECINHANTAVSWSTKVKGQIEGKINEWYRGTDSLRHGVDGLYSASLENLRIMAEMNVFSRMQVPGAPKPGDKGGNGNNGNGNQGTGNQGGGGGTPGGGGGGTPGGGGGGTPPGYTPPELPKMPEPELPKPEDATTLPGAPDPNDPNNPLGPNGKPGETVTIEEGDRKISVTSPDSEGQVKVTVDDGSGKPKTYTMDFGEAGLSGLPGGPGTPQPGGPAAFGPDGQPIPGGQQAFGPDGQPVPGGQGGVGVGGELVEPGPDGKCVISDPPMTITAERPGGGDVVLVTVDDGTGDPTSYTLDYSEANASGGTPASGVTGQPGAGGQPGVGGQPDVGVGVAGGATGGAEAMAGGAQGGGAGMSGPGGETAGSSAGSAEYGRHSQPASEAFASDVSPAAPVVETQTTSAQSVDGGAGSLGSAGSAFDAQPSSEFGPADVQAAGAGEAGLSSASGESHGRADGQSGGAMGSGMGGGMMGGGGGGGGQGGDSERAGSQWRTTGNLFDDDFAATDSRAGASLLGDGS